MPSSRYTRTSADRLDALCDELEAELGYRRSLRSMDRGDANLDAKAPLLPTSLSTSVPSTRPLKPNSERRKLFKFFDAVHNFFTPCPPMRIISFLVRAPVMLLTMAWFIALFYWLFGFGTPLTLPPSAACNGLLEGFTIFWAYGLGEICRVVGWKERADRYCKFSEVARVGVCQRKDSLMSVKYSLRKKIRRLLPAEFCLVWFAHK